MKLTTVALTDIGRVRRQNEDRFMRDESKGLFGVADGVGGLPGGAEAARLTVDSIISLVAERFPADDDTFIQLVRTVSRRVAALGRELSPGFGIGTTLTCGLIRANSMRWAHVGDSRAYLLRAGRLHQVTEDHSVENEAKLRRARGEMIEVHFQNRNALTRCIGQPDDPKVDVGSIPLEVGDRILFASDGITRVLDETELSALLAPPTAPQDCLDEIVRVTNYHGGPDNSTAVLVVVEALD